MTNESLTPIIETQGSIQDGRTSYTYMLSLNGQAIPDITSDQLHQLARLSAEFAKMDEQFNKNENGTRE
jgi:hypothetical protein